MKYFLILLLFLAPIYAAKVVDDEGNELVSPDSNATVTIKVDEDSDQIIVEDTSGLSDEQVRDVAKNNDKDEAKKKKKVTLDEAIDTMLDGTFTGISQKPKQWKDLSPHPIKYDWIQTKSGEWFKGYIKAMYDDELEFDSDEIGLYVFDFKDIVRIKSYQILGVSIENVAIFEGIIRFKDDEMTIIQGNNKFKFTRDRIVSLARSGTQEMHKWYAKITASIDQRSGNSEQMDYTAQAVIKRRTAKTRLVLDYLSRFTKVGDTITANDHRINEKFDIYFTRNFYLTPIFSEYYTDTFKNISLQLTAGTGIGYMLINTKKLEWDITSGPAILYTRFESVTADEKKKVYSSSLETTTKIEYEINKIVDFTYSYRFTYTTKDAGTYKHYMYVKFENEITKWLDFDITYTWDYIHTPTINADGTLPEKNDFQLLLGLGVEY